MNIEVTENENGGEFYIDRDGRKSAVMEFTNDGTVMNITHTEVQDSMQGEGVGRKLVAEGEAYAKRKNLKLEASCSYARKVLGL